jgi:pimeloyl-ACP methyl ester carboxylesterase
MALKAVCDLLTERIGAEHAVFENAAHNPQLEMPQEFNARLQAFLDSV